MQGQQRGTASLIRLFPRVTFPLSRAKHYLSDKKGWEETARYWTEIYANGSESARPPETTAGSGGGVDAGGADDDAKKAGLKPEHVEQFCSMVRWRRGEVNTRSASD